MLIADSEVSSIRGINLAKQQVRTICGSGELFGFGDVDGRGAEVRLQHCLGVEYFQDYLWIADTYNNKIKRVDICTGICETVLEGGTGDREDETKSLKFSEPSGLSGIDSFLFIADTNNHIIRRADINTWEVNIINFPQLCAPDICFPSI